MKLGMKLGAGMTAEVFVLNCEKVVKLFFESIPKSWIQYEYSLAYTVGNVYYNAPKAYEIVEYSNRQGIVYERVNGSELADLLIADFSKAKTFGKALSDLHINMHEITVDEFPSQKDRLKNSMNKVSSILGERLERLIERLDSVTFDNKICHGDLHLSNVMLDEGVYRVIDWMNAAKGTPIADVCRTILMLDTPYSVECVPYDVKAHIKGILEDVKTAYLEHYFSRSGASASEMRIWMPLVAAARLSEQVPGEKEWLLEIVDQGLRELEL